MHEQVRIHHFSTIGTERVARAWRFVASQPSWLTRLAFTVFLLVVGLPLMALFLFAMLLAIAVFLVLAGVNALIGLARGLFPRNDGRDNVRIVSTPRRDRPAP